MQSHERKRGVFLQWVSTVYVPRTGEEPQRLARKEVGVRPGSPALTRAEHAEQVCLRASRLCAEPAGPWAGQPLPSVSRLFPTTDVPAWVRLPGHAQIALCSGQVQGTSGRTVQGTKASLSSPTTVKTTSFVGCRAPNLPQHYRHTTHILRLPRLRQTPVQEPGTAGWLCGRTSWA